MKSRAPAEEQPQAPGHAGAAQVESSSAKKALGVLVDTTLNLSQQRRPTVSWAARRGALPAVEEDQRCAETHWISVFPCTGRGQILKMVGQSETSAPPRPEPQPTDAAVRAG